MTDSLNMNFLKYAKTPQKKLKKYHKRIKTQLQPC
jgi:hypothetical protein